MQRFQQAFVLFVACVLAVISAAPAPPSQLQIEYLNSPAVIDTRNPRCSWALNTRCATNDKQCILKGERAQFQSAYRIIVSSDEDQQKIICDTGKVLSSETQLVPCCRAQNVLQSDATYYWTVTWWEKAGIESPPSSPARFDVALVSPSDWMGATWLGAPQAGIHTPYSLYRAPFTLPAGAIVRARAYVAGLGLHEFHLNGQKVGKEMLAPGWTQYSRRVLYLDYDVTSLLLAGQSNCLGLMLGEGYRDSGPFPNSDGDTPKTDTHAKTLKVYLSITLANGQSVHVVSTQTANWTCSSGAVQSASIYDGLNYDARKEQPGWDTVNFKPTAAWVPAVAVGGPSGVLSVQSIPGVHVTHTFSPLSVAQPKTGHFVFDMGKNFAGVCRLTVSKCPAGQTITIKHAEILKSDGSGMIYVENLRSAKATDVYICKGGVEKEEFTPMFTYHGFRYVEITGFPGTPTVDTLLGLHFHSDLSERGTLSLGFEADSIFNRLYDMNVLVQRSNLMSVPTDCPQRDERLGWMGDFSLSAETFALNFDSAAFFTHFIRLIADEMDSQGTLTDVVPFQRYGGRPGDPAWTHAFIQGIYVMYKYHGDRQLPVTYLSQMIKYLTYVAGRATQSGLAKLYASYGDWCPPRESPRCSNSYLASATFVDNIQQLYEMTGALGLSDAHKWAGDQLTKWQSAFISSFYSSTSHYFDNGVQTAQFFAFQLGLSVKESYTALQNYLLNDIVSTHNTHMTTGISGFKSLWRVLSSDAFHQFDLLAQLALTTDYPSIGWMQFNPTEPATGVWELLDAPTQGPGMNSRAHHMFSSYGQAWYEVFGGLVQADVDMTHDNTTIGYQSIIYRPLPSYALSTASVSLQTGRGQASLDWERSGGMQCSKVSENMVLSLSCNDDSMTITSIEFASFGTPRGVCGAYGINTKCHSSKSVELVSSACVGKSSCTIQASDTQFGDPCYDTLKYLVVQAHCSAAATDTLALHASIVVPTGSTAHTYLPLLSLSSPTLTDTSETIYEKGKFLPNVVPGVRAVTHIYQPFPALLIEHDGGIYDFRMQGSEGVHVCAVAKEHTTLSLSCPDQKTIGYVAFASFGSSPSTCNEKHIYNVGDCHAGSSRLVVESACLGHSSCSLLIEDTTFGDPCYDTEKSTLIDVVCFSN
eukprot:TRINITY_DN3624_c0_g1_i1.p1 TRINITY_DN3624_c0_g1~~TRINITY_DN3624_c0_g1_i1.p1  ORF type:complete len:1151 (-),score=344.41 TRINITY_DN3624_c0_g1_i1:219-3671(-)